MEGRDKRKRKRCADSKYGALSDEQNLTATDRDKESKDSAELDALISACHVMLIMMGLKC